MPKNFTAIIFAAVLMSVSGTLLAQTGGITGTVQVPDGPAAFANVSLKGTSKGTVANADGQFALESIEPGNYEVVISSVGFETKQIRAKVQAGETTQLGAIDLSVSVSEMQAIEITGRKASSYKPDYTFGATKMEMSIKDVPQSMSVVTKELIRDMRAIRLQDVTQSVAGVTFNAYDYFYIRGFGTEEGRLYNGLRLPWNVVPPALFNVERIEIIKGPASALFSNCIPGGMVNYVTKKPLDEKRNSFDFTVGSWNNMRAAADFTGPLNEDNTLLYRVNFGYENTDSYRQEYFNKTYFASPSITFLPDDKTRINAELILNYNASVLDRGQPVFPGATRPDKNTIDLNVSQSGDYMNINSTSFVLSGSREIAPWITLNASYMNSRMDRKQREHGAYQVLNADTLKMYYDERSMKESTQNITTYINMKANMGEVKNTILAGFDFIYSSPVSTEKYADSVGYFVLSHPEHSIRPIESYTTTSSSGGDLEYKTYGIYGQLLSEYKKLKILLSLRQEMFDQEIQNDNGDVEVNRITALIPRVGITYSIAENVNVYGTWNNGFQPVNIWYQSPTYGGPFTKPERSDLFEVGAKAELFKKQLLATAALYQLTKRNALIWANDPDAPNLYRQRGEERSRGFELELQGKLNPDLTLSAAYAFCDAVIVNDGNPENDGKVKEYAPRHSAGLFAKYQFKFGLGAIAGYSYVSEKTTYQVDFKLPAYSTFNLGFTYEIDKVDIAFNIRNLTNKTHWTQGDLQYGLIPGAPRNYLVSIGYRL